MNLLAKIENAINFLLLKITELLLKLVPYPVKALARRVQQKIQRFQLWCKTLPKKAIVVILALVTKIKLFVQTTNVKETFNVALKNAQTKGKLNSSSKWKAIFMMPFLVIGQWLQGLTAAQSLLLLTFSAGSILSVIGMTFSGQRIMSQQMSSGRGPASAEEEIEYNRPKYYKKQIRHFGITNLRLAVYIPKINEVRSVDIDFTATLSNRNARLFLEKYEFQLRDHLIVQIEPSVASFPLEEEGKEIIRKKIWHEINEFLEAQKIEGEVKELKITYILAN